GDHPGLQDRRHVQRQRPRHADVPDDVREQLGTSRIGGSPASAAGDLPISCSCQAVPVLTLTVDVAGWIGMALLIGAYALVTTGRILGPSLTFQLMNLLGGALLMVNSGWYGAWPSAALNLVWVVIGTVGLV